MSRRSRGATPHSPGPIGAADRLRAARTERDLSEGHERPRVSDQPERSGKVAFVRALNVRRNAALGLAVGAVVAAAVFVRFVLRPETLRPEPFYVALAFVLAVSLGGLVATVLTIGSAVRLARADDDDRSGAS